MNQTLKKILIKTKKQVFSEIIGNNTTNRKGEGYDFCELKEYEYGEDVKNIDWVISAKLQKPYVKIFHSQKELNIKIVSFLSGSTYFGTDIFKQDMQNVSLAELYQNRAERLKNKEKSKEGERNQNFIWNRTIDLQLNEKINIPKVKLKDVGNLRKYEKDPRVEAFLSYNDISNWMAYLPNDWEGNEHSIKLINVIDIQLDEYEKIRQHELLKEVQSLEYEIYNKATNKEELLQEDNKGNKNPNCRKYIVNGLIKSRISTN